MKHTKEPWKVDEPHQIISMSNFDYVAVTEWGDHLFTEEECAENARRIVACVNACEGIPNEILDDPHDSVLISKKDMHEFNVLKYTRDTRIAELEAALESLIVLAELGFRIARLECSAPEVNRFEKYFRLAKEILAGDEK